MKKVLTFGTFDLIHPGHVNFLKQAKKHGNFLIVVVARDKTVRKLKGKRPHFDEKQRLKNIKKLKIASKVILGKHNLRKKYDIIEKTRPDVICLGYDQKFFIKVLPKLMQQLKLKTEIIRLKPFRPRLYKSSILKKNLLKVK